MKESLKFKVFIVVLSLCFVTVSSFFLVSCSSQSEQEPNSATASATETSSVPIAMAADNNYTYPTIVSITSLMTNSNENTNYDIYIMVQGGFEEANKQKLLVLQEKYDNRCKITLIDMKDRYKNANDKGHITTPTYYRLSLSSLLPDLNKIIWMDGDTLIFEDLTDLIKIDMENLYYRGFLDYPYPMECFNFAGDHYICAGVMLINLEKLRQDNMEAKFEDFIEKNNENLVQHDQTVINVLCQENLAALPAKYGIWNFENLQKAREHAGVLKAKDKYSADDMQSAFEHPAILHCIWKPWWNNGAAHNQELWLSYAAKTDYLKEIKEKYGI